MPKFEPTDEQGAIMAAVADPAGGSVMVEAGAGCAKSATLQLAAPGIRVPALGLAFNRAIAKELQPKLPGNFKVQTFNGLGYGAWMRANPQISRFELDERKLGKLVSQTAKDRKISLSSDQWDSCRRFVSAVMQAGLSPGNIGTPLLPDEPENWMEIADAIWIPREDVEFLVDIAREVLERDIALAKEGKISFDDQIYCSAILGGQFPKYPVLFADESQDLSPLNHLMIQHSIRPDGRLVAVGDSRQAIYAFRGADSDSMRKMRAVMPRWADRQLTMTFRCPAAIVKRQLEHYPAYRAAPGNPEGLFHQYRFDDSEIELEGQGWNIPEIRKLYPAGRSLAVLCRNNAPILSLAFKLIRGGQGCQVFGRDIGKGLLALSKKILPDDNSSAVSCVAAISDWLEREESLARANGKEEKVAGIRDKGESLLACLQGSGARSAGELRAVIEQLFEREAGQIVLSSIHRAKGLEWDTVVHLDPWRIPSKFAKRLAAAGDTSQLKQEFNLRYVAETRTRFLLVNANLENYNG